MTIFRYSIALLLFMFTIASCKKNKSSLKTSAVLTITHSGGMYIGETVNFSSSASAGTFTWFFDDSSAASASSNPAHIYTAPGSHSVMLVHNSTDTARLTLHIGTDSAALALLSGVRLFHHAFEARYEKSPGFVADTTYARADTNIGIYQIDPITVAFGNDTLTYLVRTPPIPGAILFWHDGMDSYGGSSGPNGNESEILYYPANDSIVYTFNQESGALTHNSDSYWTP